MAARNSHKTAISRIRISAPTRWLRDHGHLRGRILDFGCGKGFDSNDLRVERYDPYHFPQMPEGQFDTILCVYVLNVMPAPQAARVIERVRSKLAPGGTAYFAVRRDIKTPGVTSKGTYQRNVLLPFELLHEKKGRFCIYAETRTA